MPAHVEAALSEHGMVPAAVELLSPLRERKGTRLAWRVDTRDGGRIKARDLGSEHEARRVFDIRARLDTAFAPALGRHGSVLIEQWIDGEPLAGRESGRRFHEAGALLGRLHGTPLQPDAPSTCATRGWLRIASSAIAFLADRGRLTRGEAAALQEALVTRDPGTDRNTIVHTDLCAENIIIDGSGALRVIDNENVAVGPAGFDLGCTFHRWPMSGADRDRFQDGYRSAAGRDPFGDPRANAFWRIVAPLMGARVHMANDPGRLEASLALLRRFARDEDLAGDTAQ